MFAVIPIQFAFAVHYFVVWPIAATLSCCLPIFFSNLHAVHTHHKCLQHVTFWVFLTFLPAVVRYSLFVSSLCYSSVPEACLRCFPLHSGIPAALSTSPLHCIALHCIALYCIVFHCIPLYCPPLLVSHLLSSLDWPWGSPSKFFIH